MSYGRCFVRSSSLIVLMLVLACWTPPHGRTIRLAETVESAGKDADVAPLADKEMNVGRYYIGKHDYPAAINRFKTVVTRYPTSADAEEALARLTEAYLALGIRAEAQCAVAVLEHKFPTSRWSRDARDMLRAGGLEPAEDATCRISRAFN